jgi:hypothetical protein
MHTHEFAGPYIQAPRPRSPPSVQSLGTRTVSSPLGATPGSQNKMRKHAEVYHLSPTTVPSSPFFMDGDNVSNYYMNTNLNFNLNSVGGARNGINTIGSSGTRQRGIPSAAEEIGGTNYGTNSGNMNSSRYRSDPPGSSPGRQSAVFNGVMVYTRGATS